MRKTLISLLLLLPVLVSAQDTIPSFSLDQAITYALEHNYSAINAERDLDDAQKQKWETIASGLPQINGAVSYQNQLKQPVSQIPAEFFGGEPGTYQEVIFGQSQSMSASATLRQQIFDGSYIVGVQATKTFLAYSANSKEKTELDVRRSVVEAYGNVLLAQESVRISERNVNTLEQNLYETKRVYENGLGDEESVDQLQITLSSMQNYLKNAQRMEKITLQMLNLVLGLPIDAPTELTENLDDLTQSQIDFQLLDSEFNIENNVDYKMAVNLNEQRALELKLAKSYALPTLNAFVNYGGNSFSNEFNFFSSGQQWFGSSILGVDLNIPIFSSLRRSATTQRAKIALDKAKTQFTEAQAQIRLQLETAKSDYILAIEQYGTSKENLELAERIEKKNEIKYTEGLATSFELRQAQTQLYTNQQEYLQSMVDVILKKTELENILNQ
ncbi:TolC family protein [Flagellimonas zhangzhouensis]|uniref:Outer membrane protein TolC n=1 Tax=Flagellimonas zhangzhouensis TaxID=1073328 RepID=A0A1H2UE19_9FLAO|nr:TolC family protein [Allomuricauda zhangzhouensis]SDQ18021.1 Outer membrane protein TolC [Allomuricauda zhangzhouensis]SDW54158.1 Outer membrane protein TolC [Allomuricauda zhangzhouensis]